MNVQTPQRANLGRDRRIGERHPIAETIELTLPAPGRLRRTPKPVAVSTDDLSLSGAGFTGGPIPQLRVHLPIVVKVGGVSGPAVVRKVVSKGYSRMSYGIEFMDPRLGEAAGSVIERRIGRSSDSPKNARPPMAPTSPYWSDLVDWS